MTNAIIGVKITTNSSISKDELAKVVEDAISYYLEEGIGGKEIDFALEDFTLEVEAKSTDEKYYESPEEIVEAYKNGSLKETYPILVVAIDLVLRSIITLDLPKDKIKVLQDALDMACGAYTTGGDNELADELSKITGEIEKQTGIKGEG